MKYFGDIPPKDKELMKELEVLEAWFYKHGGSIPMLQVAKGFVCMAHDYYYLEMEEEGDRLIKIAEKYCPGYFTGPIHIQARKEKDFSLLLKGLKKTMALDLMVSLGFQDEEQV